MEGGGCAGWPAGAAGRACYRADEVEREADEAEPVRRFA